MVTAHAWELIFGLVVSLSSGIYIGQLMNYSWQIKEAARRGNVYMVKCDPEYGEKWRREHPGQHEEYLRELLPGQDVGE